MELQKLAPRPATADLTSITSIACAAAGTESRTSVDKAMDVLKAFGDDANIGVGVSELARRAGLSKSTTFRLLGMLERNDLVERVGTAYRFGRAIHLFGEQSSDSRKHDRVRDLLTPFLADLFVATHLTVQLAVLDGQHVVYLNKLEAHQRLRSPSRIGGRMPGYCTAVGKILTALDPEASSLALAGKRHPWTPNTLVEDNALRLELARVRKEGIAHDRGESLETLSCIAAPVIDHRGFPVAALSISGPSETFRAHEHEHTLRQVSFAASRTMARFNRDRAA
jgi:DNA-binding IclR family transcriptional regulator